MNFQNIRLKNLFLISIFTLSLIPCSYLYSDEEVIDRLKSDVTFLCSPELAGRDVPGPTGDRAAHWVADRFREIGLQPVDGESGFFQQFQLTQALLDTVHTRLTIMGDGWKQRFRWGEGFYVFPR